MRSLAFPKPLAVVTALGRSAPLVGWPIIAGHRVHCRQVDRLITRSSGSHWPTFFRGASQRSVWPHFGADIIVCHVYNVEGAAMAFVSGLRRTRRQTPRINCCKTRLWSYRRARVVEPRIAGTSSTPDNDKP